MTESECRKDISHLTRKSTHLGKNERPLEKTFTGPKITDSDTNGASSSIGRICLSICEQYVSNTCLLYYACKCAICIHNGSWKAVLWENHDDSGRMVVLMQSYSIERLVVCIDVKPSQNLNRCDNILHVLNPLYQNEIRLSPIDYFKNLE